MDEKSDPIKLTLRLESRIIERAKQYARDRGTSVSQMVADYFDALTREERREGGSGWEEGLGPVTRSLVGVLEGGGLEEEDYRKHLDEKHLGIHDDDGTT